MNETEKSIALAELMKWKVVRYDGSDLLIETDDYAWLHQTYLKPYKDGPYGLAQFALILLGNMGVMTRFVAPYCDGFDNVEGRIIDEYPQPTQETILDEILRMKGKME